jgi:hypothetical protein
LLHEGAAVDDGEEGVEAVKEGLEKVHSLVGGDVGRECAGEWREWWLETVKGELEVVATVLAGLFWGQPGEGDGGVDRGRSQLVKHAGQSSQVGLGHRSQGIMGLKMLRLVREGEERGKRPVARDQRRVAAQW